MAVALRSRTQPRRRPAGGRSNGGGPAEWAARRSPPRRSRDRSCSVGRTIEASLIGAMLGSRQVSARRAKRSARLAELLGEQLRPFRRGEVAALVDFVEV